MEIFNSYYVVIFLSCVIILSYFYNVVASKTNIPSVLLLIATGVVIQQAMSLLGIPEINWFPILEILGIVGLIMIVLEAALDLKLERKKFPIIFKAMATALGGLIICSFAFAFVIHFFFETDQMTALLYAIPISIISSAIVIPSVVHLDEDKKEFLIYEGTFSDIFGIMFFYFLLDGMQAPEGASLIGEISFNVIITIILSFVLSYVLILIFQNISSHTKFFLLIAVLILLYDVGKLFHLSSLLIILVFGMLINNYKLFFFGFLKRYIKEDAIQPVLQNFKIVTLETAFVVRTFFFLIFGISISLAALLDAYVFLSSMVILALLYLTRLLVLKIVPGTFSRTNLFIAPRGLITILLFFAIPASFQIEGFDSGILLYVILITSGVMSYALIKESNKDVFEEVYDEVKREMPPYGESSIQDESTDSGNSTEN